MHLEVKAQGAGRKRRSRIPLATKTGRWETANWETANLPTFVRVGSAVGNALSKHAGGRALGHPGGRAIGHALSSTIQTQRFVIIIYFSRTPKILGTMYDEPF
eukprot:1707279-Rhodomonas_salina.1